MHRLHRHLKTPSINHDLCGCTPVQDSFVIRSFVRREGRFTKGQQAAFKNYWPVYGIDVAAAPLDLAQHFDHQRPLVLDIGFGNGEALAGLAAQHPQLNFLGVEVYRPGIGVLLRKLASAQLDNVRIIHMDAVELLRQHLVGEHFVCVLIWFPDPWPKKRHHKRRLIQAGFLSLLASRLHPQGELHITTDWHPYAQHIQATFKASGLFNKVNSSAVIQQRPTTKFEHKAKKLGHRVFTQVYRKIN